MLINIAYRMLLIIALQFVVASGAYAFSNGNVQRQDDEASQSPNVGQFSAIQHTQNERDNLRSRSDVIQEVKRRYDAEVLKISLDERTQVYRVRVLMPNGKVRDLKISARR
jgi:uncharacterized membrane protein YkoI